MTGKEKIVVNGRNHGLSMGALFIVTILLFSTLLFLGSCALNTGRNSSALSVTEESSSLTSHTAGSGSFESGFSLSSSTNPPSSSRFDSATDLKITPSSTVVSKPVATPTPKPTVKPTATPVPTLIPGDYIPKINPETGYDESLTGRNLFLTYDDGPSSNNTPIVLATLKKYHVKATFFVCGPDTPERRALIKQEFEQGHAIGIHCYSHYLNKLYASESSFFADFNKIEAMVKAVTGIQPVLYRFPGGTNNGFISKSLSDLIIRKLKDKGYEYYDWNVSSQDSANPSVQQIANNVITQCRNRVKAKTPSLILIHDSGSRTNSATATDLFLKELTRAGYYFASLDKTVPPVHFRK